VNAEDVLRVASGVVGASTSRDEQCVRSSPAELAGDRFGCTPAKLDLALDRFRLLADLTLELSSQSGRRFAHGGHGSNNAGRRFLLRRAFYVNG
jgi:hypothetical protein